MSVIPLGKLCELKYGKSLRKDKRIHGTVPVYGSNGIVDFHNEHLVDNETIIVGRKGSIGEIHYVSGPSWPIDTTYFVELKKEYDIDLKWFYRVLRSLRLPELNKSAAIPGLNRDDVYRIKIHLPSLDDQIRIAHLLSKVEGLIARRKQQLQQLDGLLKSVFLDMFGDPVRNLKGHRISTLGHFITHLTSGGRGWAKYYSPSGKRFIRSLDVQMNAIGSDDIVYVTPPENKETERTKVQPGDVLLTITGSKIGRVCFVPAGFEEAYISQHVAIIRTQGLNPVYLSYYLSMPNCGQRTIRKQQYGQAKPGLNLPQISKFEILEPEPILQNQFAIIVAKVEGIKTFYQQSLTKLEHLYSALSQKAFKGELDLSHVPLALAQVNTEIREQHEKESLPPLTGAEHPKVIELPDPTDLQILHSVKGRDALISQWLDAYLGQLAGREAFSVADFLEAAQLRMDTLMEEEVPDLGLAAYERLKGWVFHALESGRLTQTYDDDGNRVRLSSAKA